LVRHAYALPYPDLSPTIWGGEGLGGRADCHFDETIRRFLASLNDEVRLGKGLLDRNT
jgi:hypothetical protein